MHLKFCISNGIFLHSILTTHFYNHRINQTITLNYFRNLTVWPQSPKILDISSATAIMLFKNIAESIKPFPFLSLYLSLLSISICLSISLLVSLPSLLIMIHVMHYILSISKSPWSTYKCQIPNAKWIYYVHSPCL